MVKMSENKKIWIWLEDSEVRKAIITDNKVTFYDEKNCVLLSIINPSKSIIKQIEKNILEKSGKIIDKKSDFTYLNDSNRKR